MELKAKQVENAKEGMHADGKGLYLRVQPGGAKSWILRFQLNGKRREMGLGSLDGLGLIDARAETARLRVMLAKGIDPIEYRRAELEAAAAKDAETKALDAAAGNTFKKSADDYIASHKDGWKSAKHSAQWTATLAKYAYPHIGDTSVADVSTDDVLAILKPIWASKTETASRVRSRIELVLDAAKARKLRTGDNPATWAGHLEALLPKPSKVKTVRNQPALPYARMPEFMEALKSVPGMGARALEFAILTTARSGEVRGATWSEVDLDSGVWRVSAARMKAGREHQVPLSSQALGLLRALHRFDNCDYLFPGERKLQPLSDMSISAVTRRMNEGKIPMPWVDPANGDQVVPHGFRSTFRDWAGDISDHPGEMAELALAHKVSDKVEAAYRRSTMFEKRRAMMQDWSDWCFKPAVVIRSKDSN